jgi:mannose/fructose-specific phosphotransferase system component IIA
MNSRICGVVVAHGRVAEALVDAAEGISGVTDALVPVSNDGCDRDRLEDRIAEAINGRSSVVFVDLPSGSCLLAALHRFRGQSDVKVVTGVNLAMLLDFLFHRELPLHDVAEHVAGKGCGAIRVT